MDADGVLDDPRLTGIAGHGGVQVCDLAEAVAAELQRVGPLGEQELARVEVGLPVAEPRIPVRHDHLRDRRPVDHRPFAKPDLVQDQPFAGVEADPQRPVLPAQQIPLQREARPLRLGDLDGPQRGAVRAAHCRVVVVAGLLRHRQLELVDDFVDLLLDQVHVRGDAIHRMRPGQVVLARLDEREHAHHPPPVVVSRPEDTRGDRAGPDLGDVGQPAPGHGRTPRRVRADHLLDHREVGLDDRQLAIGAGIQPAYADHLAPAQRHHHVGRLAGAQVDEEGAEPAIRLALRGAQQYALGWLLQAVIGEPGRLGQQAGGRHDVPAGQVLRSARRVEWVGGKRAWAVRCLDGRVGHHRTPLFCDTEGRGWPGCKPSGIRSWPGAAIPAALIRRRRSSPPGHPSPGRGG